MGELVLWLQEDPIINKFDPVTSDSQTGTMSKLEQLARAKVLAAQHLKLRDGKDNESPVNRSISLLSKLQKSNTVSGGPATQSLSERLKTLKINKSVPASSREDLPDSKKQVPESASRSSLSSKLQALRSRQAPKPVDTNALNGNVSKPESTEQPVAQETRSRNLWRRFQEKEVQQFANTSANSSPRGLLGISKTLLEPPKEDDRTRKIRKKRYLEIFTVFYPIKKRDTNSSKTAQQKAARSFASPSPDDVVINAQKAVFDEVKDNVSKLKISNKDQVYEALDNDNHAKKTDDEEQVPRQYKKLVAPTKPRDPIDIEKYLKEMKPHCSFVVLGHVDAGKSTLMGRLLFDVGAVDMAHIRKLKRESERIGKGSFHLAWVMDQTAEERERGVTVSICTSDFETAAAKFTIVDAPGHRDFVPSAISGISQADVAVLSIDCGTDAFESGFNLDGQTKEHTLLARSMGVSRVIVAMNKMDTVAWDSSRFNQIKNELGSFFQDIGLKKEHIFWVPCSGLSGEGVYKTPYPENQTWYKGPNLIEQLELVAKDFTESFKEEIVDSRFLFSTLEVIPSSKNEEASITGKVESGYIQPGESITLYPSGQGVLVDKILTGNEKTSAPVAIKGDFVTLKLRNAHAEDIEAGDLATSIDFDIKPLDKFRVQLLTFSMERPLLPGTPFVLFRGVCQQPARISALEAIVSKSDPQQVLKKKVRHLGSNKAAIVEIELTDRKRWVPILTYSESKHLGRVLLRKDGRTIAAGVVMS